MYKINVIYSHEDEGYIATVPELPGCSAFGETREEALEEIEVAKSLSGSPPRRPKAELSRFPMTAA